jgi:hypothetical protein
MVVLVLKDVWLLNKTSPKKHFPADCQLNGFEEGSWTRRLALLPTRPCNAVTFAHRDLRGKKAQKFNSNPSFEPITTV